MTYETILTALSDATRRRIVALLQEGPKTVGTLADALPVSQPAVSQHLKVLRDAGLVVARSQGVRRIHALRVEGFGPLRAWVESFWEEALGSFASSLQDPDEEEER